MQNNDLNVRSDTFLAGGGEMGARMYAHDWTKTPLGAVAAWPQSLRTAVSILLNSKYPMFIGWGSELVFFYNDAYRPILGATKHPDALGRPTREVWVEIWDTLGPLAARAVNEGEPTWSDDLVLMMNRYGYVEETYFTFSYSPIRDEVGGVGGMFCACTETTGTVLGERRLRCLRDLATAAADARTVEDANRRCLRVLESSATDIAFALLYRLENDDRAQLTGSANIEPGAPAAPRTLDAGAGIWPLARAARGDVETIKDLPSRFAQVPRSVWGDPICAALILPIPDRGQTEASAVLVLGVNPRRDLDQDFRSFLNLVAGNIATAIANARAFEEERQRAEALAEICRFRTIVKQATTGVVQVDPTGRMTLVNQCWCEMLGYTEAELLQMTIADVTDSDDLAPTLEAGCRLANGGTDCEIEQRYRRKDGSILWASGNANALRSVTGEYLGLAAVVLDITERKQAEEALRESEQRFAAIFNQAAGGIARVDLSGRFTMVNDCYCRIVGRAREQLLTMRLQDLTHPDDLLSSQAHFQAAVEHGRPFTIEKRYLRPNGSTVWVSKDVAAVRNPHGKPVGVIAICQDITARRQTEQLLTEQKKLLEMIALGAPLDDCLSALCAAMPKLNAHTRAGILLADAQHQRFLRSIAPDLSPSFDQELKGAPINNDHLGMYGDAVFRARPISCADIANDGGWSQQWRDLCLANHILACHSAPILSVDGLSLGAFILCFDELRAPNEWERRLTEFGTHIASIALERDRASQTLRESEARYRALSEVLERRVEVRTAELQHQAAWLRRLAGELTSAEQRERKRLAAILHDGLQQLLVAAKMRLAQVHGKVRDAAALSTIESVTDLLSQAVDSSRNLTQQLRPPVLYEGGLMPALRWLASELPKLHDLHVAIDTEEMELPLSDDIKALLFESVRELLFNVVKHAGVKEAAVRVQQDGQWLQIAVEDEGSGFNVDAVAQEQDTQQCGIGLFSIRERLAALGGDVAMESIPNGGTRIRLIVPLPQAGGGKPAAQSTLSPVPAGTETPAPLAEGRQARVLVVDDHAIVREGISNVLSGDERLVVVGEAADGVEAIEAVERHQPDVVLIDVNMPRMNGVEATREIRRRWPAVRIVALSVQDDAATARTMIRAGAAAFVSKSDDAGQMIQVVLAPVAKN